MTQLTRTSQKCMAHKTPLQMYSIREASRLLGISRSTVYKLIKMREICSVKIAGRRLISGSELDRVTRIEAALRE